MSFYAESKIPRYKGGSKVSKYLRTALENLKQFYIKRILETDLYENRQELHSLTISELEKIYNEKFPQKIVKKPHL